MKISTVSRNAEADALAALCNAGLLRIYELDAGAPANPQAAVVGTLLVTITLQNPAFGVAVVGVITLAGTPSANAVATAAVGADFARIVKSDGTTPVMDLTVGASGQNLNLNAVAIQNGALVTVSSLTYTVPE